MLKRVQYSTGAVLPDGDINPYQNSSANDTLPVNSLEEIAVVFVADDLETPVQLADGSWVVWDAKLPDNLSADTSVLSATLAPLFAGSVVWGVTIDTAQGAAALAGSTVPIPLSAQYSRYLPGVATPYRSDRYPILLDNVVRQTGDVPPYPPADELVTDDDPRVVYASRDYVGENYRAFASRIAGKTASTATLNLFSAGDFTAGTGFVRNASAWCADVDLTCFSPWNSRGLGQQGGCLITPRHVVLANHFSNQPGSMVPGVTTIKFVAADNTIYTRLITAFNRCGTSDVLIATLESELPAAIKPARLLPPDRGGFVGLQIPVLITNQLKAARIAYANVPTSASTNTYLTPATGTFAAWTQNPLVVEGDSGSPILFIIGGVVYLDALFFAVNGGDSIGARLAQINAILGTQYALAVPMFNTAGRDNSAYHAGDSPTFQTVQAFTLTVSQVSAGNVDTDNLNPGTFRLSSLGSDADEPPAGILVCNDSFDPYPLTIWTTDANGFLRLVVGSAGKSLRVKSDGSGWEAYTPSSGGGGTFPFVGLVYSATSGSAPRAATGAEVAGALAGQPISSSSVTIAGAGRLSIGESDGALDTYIDNPSLNHRMRFTANGNQVMGLRSDGVYLDLLSFDGVNGGASVGISKVASGTLAIGNGTPGDASGTLRLANIVATLPTSASGLVAGSLWRSGNDVKIV